jgi:hypothetical protein
MTTITYDAACIEAFAVRSGLVASSVDALRPEFPRWISYMRSQGVDSIPDSPIAADGHAVNILTLLIRQGSLARDQRIEHNLRDVSGISQYKG